MRITLLGAERNAMGMQIPIATHSIIFPDKREQRMERRLSPQLLLRPSLKLKDIKEFFSSLTAWRKQLHQKIPKSHTSQPLFIWKAGDLNAN